MSLLCVQDSSVIQLTQDLAKILGLKIRKAYVRTKVHTPPTVSATSFTLPGSQMKSWNFSPSACPECFAKLELSRCSVREGKRPSLCCIVAMHRPPQIPSNLSSISSGFARFGFG